MNFLLALCTSILFLQGLPAVAQMAPGKPESSPIYRVTVVERTTKAINYQYRAGPTKIDFRGTVLMPAAKGEATVESRRGRTEIQVSFENILAPTQYGREYLTYTLWAITPEGAPRNLGEVIANGSNKARLRVTTDLQAFGLIVTAEPYASAHQPSDVVVLENDVRPETLGNTQPIQAKYELMPRGHYIWQKSENLQSALANAPKVSMSQYEAQLQLYEAQNAIGIARAANAGTYAADTIAKAEALLAEAQRLQAGRAATSVVIQNAREAAQTAEDARVIAERRRQDETLSAAAHEADRSRLAREQAQNEVGRANAEADAARAQAQAERAARQRAEADAAEARSRVEQTEVRIVAPPPPQPQPGAQQADYRLRLLAQLNDVLSTRDTPRGLVVTVADSAFSGTELRQAAAAQVARIAAVLVSQPRLRVDVEGYSDDAISSANSRDRAQAVQRILLGVGLPRDRVSARGLGDTRPLVSNSSPSGRQRNRRVEIVVSGEAIGTLANWDRTYSLLPRR